MRLTDGTMNGRKSSYGLFYNGQSDPAVRSPMLGARASQNCNHGSPTCYYMRVILSGTGPKFIWVDGGNDPTQGNWQTGDLCADNPHYKTTSGYIIGPAYNYGARTGPWHAPKFLQTPGSEGIVLDVELRTAAGVRNGGLTGDDAWLVARDLTVCSGTVDVPEAPVVDFSALYPGFDPTHTTETQGYGPAFTESTASALLNNGSVSLQSGIYCVTLSTYRGDDSHGTAVVCYDASLGKGHWFDAISGRVGPDVGGWGQPGFATTKCVTPTCLPMGIYISALHMNFGLTPYLKLEMTNHVFWDMQGLDLTVIVHNGLNERFAADHVIANSLNQFSMWPLLDYSQRTPITYPSPYGWAKPSNYENKVVLPGGLYFNSSHIDFTGTGDPGVAFISASNKNSAAPCLHDAGGTCGIYGVSLDGSGTEYSFFPHFASMQPGGTCDTVKPNLAAYIDAAGFTWIYWGSDWMGNLGCSDGVTASNCSVSGAKNRADVFAAVVR